MKKLLSLILTISMLLTCIGGVGVYAEESDTVTKTYGLDNLNNEAGEIKVAFIGGSITYGQSADPRNTTRYSTQVVEEFFKEKFPNKTVTEINAGVGGTPSDYGAYRVGKDVSTFSPDVVFVEFAVNDWYRNSAEIRASMESIVRQLNDLPKVPVIIFLYTHKEGTSDAVKESTKAGLENAITEHQKVASYYGIGSINIHEYIESLETSGTYDWYNGTASGTLSVDGTHPNTEGHNLYAEYITKCLKDNYNLYFKNPKARNAQLEQTVMYGNPTTVFYEDAIADGSAVTTGTWEDSEELQYLQTGSHDWVIHPENLNSTWVQASEGGETFTYTFTGRSLGLAYGTIYKGSTISYVIDEGTDAEKSGTLTCNIEKLSPGTADAIRYTHRFSMLANNLEFGEHTVKLTNTADGDNTYCGFSHFLVDTEVPVIGVDEVPAYVFDHVPSGEMPTNILGVTNNKNTYGSAARSFQQGVIRNSENIKTAIVDNTDFSVAARAAKERYVKAVAEIVEDSSLGYEGITINNNDSLGWFANMTPLQPSTSYVFSFKAKNVGTTEAEIGVAISNETNASLTYSKEYGKGGMKLSSEYEQFKATIKTSPNFDSEKNNIVAIGFPAGTPAETEIYFTVEDGYDSVYLAEEKANEITNTLISGAEKLSKGQTATFEAEVKNQLGLTGYLNQNFTWYALNADRTEFVSGIEITPSADTKTAEVTVSGDIESGTYAIVAVADDYNIAMGREIFVVGEGYYNDYVPEDKPANLLGYGDDTAARIFYAASSNTSPNDVTIFRLETNWVRPSSGGSGYYDTKTYTVGASGVTTASGGSSLAGTLLRNTINQFRVNSFDSSKSYVFSMKARNAGETSGVRIGLGMLNYGTANTESYTKEYGSEGMLLTSEYQEFKGTIKPASTYNNAAEVHSLVVGMPIGTAANSVVYIDTSSDDAVYFAEEKAYDIRNTKVSGSDKLSGEESATFKAEVVNQLGLPGYLDQNFTWYAMNLERTEIIDTITVTTSADTKTATVSLNDNVKTGKYAIVAVSEDYNFAKGAEIYAVGADYYKDFVSSNEMPDNIIMTDQGANTSSARNFRAGAEATDTSKIGFEVVDTNAWVTAAKNYAEQKMTAKAEITGNANYGFEGVKISTANSFYSTMEKIVPSKNYVISFRVKNNGSSDAKLGVAVSNGTNGTVSYSKEYGESGMTLSSDYQEFKATIKASESFVSANENVITIGFPKGSAAGTEVYFDTGILDSPYFAEEVASNITVNADGATTISAGGTVKLTAEIVNQLGLTGYLDQNVSWCVMNTERTEFVEGLTVTENQDGTVTVTADDNTALGTYAVVAVSENYNMVKGVNITVTEKSEEISALAFTEASGMVMVDAKVENTKAEEIAFIFAEYKGNALSKVTSQDVTVTEGVAELTQHVLNDYSPYENGTVIRVFVWDDMRPIKNTKNFETLLTVTTAE